MPELHHPSCGNGPHSSESSQPLLELSSSHLRMERHRQRRGGDGHRRQSRDRGYGTQQQSQVAEERAQINLRAPMHNGLHSEQGSQLSGKGKSNGRESTVQLSSVSTLAPSERLVCTGAEAKTYLSSPYWWAGILLMTVGEAGNFLAYGFAQPRLCRLWELLL